MNRLEQKYVETVKPSLMKDFNYTSPMECPKIEKVVINFGVGDAIANPKLLEEAVNELTQIAGQKPVLTLARKSIAGFKIRDGWPIGCKVTLRRDKMYEFLDRLINISIPRTRDFRGLSAKSFDGRGNYSFGVKEQIIFPEIDFEKTDAIRGMDITFTTTAANDEQAKALLDAFGFPFRG